MKIHRFAAAACIAACVAASPSAAQDFPSRLVHLVVPQAAGGGTDTFARALGQKLSERSGQPGEMLKSEAGIRLVHVPYKGASAAIADVIGGHVDAAFASVPSVISSVQSNVVRALAVSSARRIAIAPDIPTIAESGFENFDVNPR